VPPGCRTNRKAAVRPPARQRRQGHAVTRRRRDPVRLGEPARIRRITAYDLFHPDLRQRLDTVAEDSAHRLGAPVSLVSVVLDSSQFVLGRYGLSSWAAEARGVPAEWALCSHTVLLGEPYRVFDGAIDPKHHDNPLLSMTGVRSYAGVPLRDDGGLVLGAHCALDLTPRAFTDHDVAVLDDGAGQAMRILTEHRAG
jgi:GAF domain-containing protein